MGYYAGIDVGGTKVYAIVIDEEGHILSRAKVKIEGQTALESVFDKITRCYVAACEKAKISKQDIAALGLAVPSSIDMKHKIIKHAPNLGWLNVEISSILKERFDRPVFIDNDVNMGMFGEYHFGAGKGYTSIYGMFLGTGIGGGYIVNGEIVRGLNDTASEVGHMIVKIGGPQCNCGLKGCLEVLAAKVGMIKYMQKQVDVKKKKTILDQIAPDWRTSVGSSALRKAFQKNDKIVKKALTRSAKAIGIAAANLITITGVEAIILGGGVIEELGDFFMPIIQTSMEENVFAEGAEGVQLLQSSLGDDAVALGAAWFVSLPEHREMLIYG